MPRSQFSPVLLSAVLAAFTPQIVHSVAAQPLTGQRPPPPPPPPPGVPPGGSPRASLPALTRRGLLIQCLFNGPTLSMASSTGLQVRVPAGYSQLADSNNVREQLQRARGPATREHTTVLYTMEGGVYHKR